MKFQLNIGRSICFLVLIAFLSLSACGSSEEVVIGAVLGLTTPKGEPLPINKAVLAGMELSVQDINEEGGIKGNRVRLIYRDCSLSIDLAQKEFREIASQSPVAIVTMYSHISKALTPLATEFKIPQLAVMSTDDSILDNSPYTYRYWPSAKTEAISILPIVRRLKIRKLAIINIDNGYGNAVTDELVRLLDEAGIKYSTFRYQTIDNAFEKKLAEMKACDGVQITCFPQDMVGTISRIKEIIPGKPIIGPNGITSPHYASNPLFDEVYVNAPLIYNPAFPYAAEVSKRFQDRTGAPFSQFSAIGYDSINLLVQLAAKEAHTSESIKNQLDSRFLYPGVFGDVFKGKGSRDFSFQLYPAMIKNKRVIYLGR